MNEKAGSLRQTTMQEMGDGLESWGDKRKGMEGEREKECVEGGVYTEMEKHRLFQTIFSYS